jgi:phenylalanyl-tRNA synthetase alpha chain
MKNMQRLQAFSESQYKLLNYLYKNAGEHSIDDLVEKLNMDQIFISGDAQYLSSEGWINLREEKYLELKLGKLGEYLSENGFPERKIIEALSKNDGKATIKEMPALSGLEQKQVGESLRLLKEKGWANNEKGILVLQDKGESALNEIGPDESVIAYLKKKDNVLKDNLIKELQNAEQGLMLLQKRRDAIKEKDRTKRFLSLTKEGKSLVDSGISVLKEATQLTSDLLMDGKWREVQFKKYNVSIKPAKTYPGRKHPFQIILDKTRKVFLEMGFTEVKSPYVESSFWNFDALFQPQDHPAREMQDTFFLERPDKTKLPQKKVIQSVKETHENGGKTGSLGWDYTWDIEKASTPVLRTHTTATTIRALSENPKSPNKVFSIGRVYRREAIDYKHLPVFYQVDGIVIDKDASFATLLGVLSEFYRKMGFKQFQFRPAFFPYTEPSVEVFVYLEKRKDWVEMGGAGVFRPEVTLPFGCKDPVLAWGLGLERLAMFTYDLNDIREIYLTDVKWLREVPTCL